MRKKNRYRYLIFSIILIVIAVIVSCMFYQNMSVIRKCTNKIVEASLKNEIKQNNNYIKSYLNNNIDIVENVADGIKYDDLGDKGLISKNANYQLRGMGFSNASYIDMNGNMYFEDGTFEDIRDKDYFLRSYNTKKTIIANGNCDSKIDYDCVAIIVPVYINSNYSGCICAIKNTSELREQIDNTFDYDIGFAYVIDENGYVIFRVNRGYDDENCKNFYHYMAYGDVDLVDYEDTLKEEVQYNRSGTFEVKSENQSGYFGYAPVLTHSNWTTVSYIKDNKVISYGEELSKKTIEIIFSITLIVIAASLYVLVAEINKIKQLKKMAYKDNLTGINNELAFVEYADKCLRNNKYDKYAMIIFDIKKFKYLNYKYGYDYGDKLIKKISESLQKKYYSNEVCARIESDTFVILAIEKKDYLENLNDYLEKVVQKNSGVFKFRYGIYSINNNDESITDIMEKAKLAWKHIKNDPKCDISYYNDNLLKNIMDEERIESKMRNALEHEEFKVYLQPKVNLSNDKICGAEALVRWVSEDMGFMPPGMFVPLFEKNGFISNIDFFMLEEVLKIVKGFKNNGINDITISVNQSRETINDPKYLDKILDVTKRYDVDIKNVELEITESVFVENHDKIINIIKSLKKIGFKVSMDDFGSGYSSLNLLSEMPIDILKIDRMFLNGSVKSDKNKIIIKSVIDMARQLNIEVICEGVESDNQVNFLKKSKCNMAQGYFYSKPIPADSFNNMI